MNAKTKRDEPMANHTTFKIGGVAALFLVPTTEAELSEALRRHPSALILGGGSNLLVSDAGVGAVISMEGFDSISSVAAPDGAAEVTVGAGRGFTALSRYALKRSLTGLEFAFGIPGSVGGAVVMNAGAFGGEVKDGLAGARLLADGRFEDVGPERLGLSYRSSALPKGAVVVSATFRLRPGSRDEIQKRMTGSLSQRKEKQPLELPSAGSVFKNPPGMFAGKILEELGLKGLRVGDAQISQKHANFIVNLGGATAAQVLALVEKAEAAALGAGIRLEREIKLAGSFN
ncbi:MAG: UDP-N-acetylmuramate dehydrogenase [Nitrospinae bacterium]|nr:UDP-N-acetylmuramate dehydrogenase [Nitrospinota bacterium]